MLRVIGIALISIALASAGFVFSFYAKRRLNALEDALNAVNLLEGQITHLLQPLSEAVAALKNQSTTLRQLAETECALSGPTLRSALESMSLSQPEIDIMENLFTAIPTLSAGNTAPFELAQEQLKLRIDMQRKAVQQGTSLYPKLGLLAGAAAFLLLI